MRFLRRLAKVLACVLVLLVIAAVAFEYMRRQRPQWYAEVSAAMDPQKQADAARRAQNKMSETVNWAASRQAAEARRRHEGTDGAGASAAPGRPATAPAATRPAALTVTFTQEELNALFAKWSGEFEWEQTYGRYLANPAVVIHEGRLILAGTMKDVDTVVSLHFNPTVTPQGRLDVELERVMAGRAWMPQALFDKYRQQLVTRVTAALPAHRKAAEARADGSVNEATVSATMGQLLLDVLNRQPAEPVLFVQGNRGRSVPVKVNDVAVANDAITLTVEMMTAIEREAFVSRVRETGAARTASASVE